MHSKKGAIGHIEIIISFMIFIAFVVFLLVFVNPIERGKDNQYYLEITEKELMKNISTDLTVFSVTVDQATVDALVNCFCFNYNPPYRVIARDEDNLLTNAGTSGNRICVMPVGSGTGNKKFYKLYFSPEFAENSGACSGGGTDLLPETYTLGVRNEYIKVSNKSLVILDQKYNSNYQDLRTNTFNLKNHFNIFVRTLGGEYLVYGAIKQPKETDIIAKEIPIEVINEQGEIIPAILNLQVWE